MTGAFFSKALEAFHKADIDLENDDIRIMAVASTAGKAITGATNATPIVVTVTSHGWSNGDRVLISRVGGNANANGLFVIANQATNTFELTDPVTGANVAGSGAYTSGGFALNVTTLDFENDITASIVATTGALGSKSFTNGIFDHADPTFSAVTGSNIYWLIWKKHTGTPSSSNLICVVDSWSTAPDPIVPNGGDITLQIAATGVYKLAA